MNTYICQYCKQSYQSNEERKPKYYRKDGSVYQYYDSKLFCSKECCIQKLIERRNQTLKNNPEIMKRQAKKRLQTLRNNPNILKNTGIKIGQSLKQTYKKHPEILIKKGEKLKQTLKEHPEIVEKQTKIRVQKLKNNPEIMKQAREKQKQFYFNHTEKKKEHDEKIKQYLQNLKNNNTEVFNQKNLRISNSLKQTYVDKPELKVAKSIKLKQFCINNPEKKKEATEKQKQTLKNHPEIVKLRSEKWKQTMIDHPEIQERRQNKQYQTIKEKDFISKEEQQMIQLLKDKYGKNDVIEQYRDDRYMKPNSNYRYSCDCYIKSLDLFIEYNGSRFHPKEEDKEKLKNEIKKFQIKYPNRNIEECQACALLNTIESDKIKQQVANDNKLNYLIVTSGFKELYDKNIL